MYILKEPATGVSPLAAAAKKKGLSKKAIDIIRTTQRNNIELTAIADNKANVLLSLNAIMIAALVPMVIANLETIYSHQLVLPLIFLSATCFLTICLAAKVLKPSKLSDHQEKASSGVKASPFFFGNFYNMKASDYYEYLEEGLSDPSQIKAHMAQDLFFVGKRLGYKMSWIRKAFNLFTFGIFLSILSLTFALNY